MLTDQELMAIHVQALFTHDAHARLLFVNEPEAESRRIRRLSFVFEDPANLDYTIGYAARKFADGR